MTIRGQKQTSTKKYSTNNPHPIDTMVGKNIRNIRVLKGLSQDKLATSLDNPITFQQLQKIENATNRAGSSRLYETAEVLDVSILDLFEGVNNRDSLLSTLDSDVIKLAGKLQRLPEPLRTQQVMICNELVKTVNKGL